MSNFLFDLRCAIRALRKNAFGGIGILALALGIGSNTALFSIANAILLRPLPYDQPHRLITVWETNAAESTGRVPASAPSFVAWKDQSRTIERLAAFRPWGFVLTGGAEPARVLGARASADLFALLGTRPIVGRTFTSEEDQFGKHRVVVLSEGLWRRRFGADTSLAGRSLTLNGESYAVVGVMPNDPTLIDADVWVPLALEPFALQQRGTRALTVVGRLAPGATLAQAQAEMHAISVDRAGQFPDSRGWDAGVVSLTEHLVGNVRPTVLMVWGAVALVLLIACANTANLLLTRAAARQHEVLVSLALGASRARLVRRFLVESVLLGLVGGAAGIPLALAGLRVFVSLAPAGLPRLDGVGIDLAVLVFTLMVSLLTGVLFGVGPALRSSRPNVSSALRDSAAASLSGASRSTLRNLALASQVALAVVVLIAAGLLVRSFRSLLAVDLGFDSGRVLTMTVSLADAKYGDPGRRALFFDQLLQRVQTTPGVVAAGLASHPPLAGRRLNVDIAIDGRPRTASDSGLWADNASVSADYFRALSIPVLRGRAFSGRDRIGSPPVVVINDGMARRLWPEANPIGRRIVVGSTSGADQRPREIVGIVADVRTEALESAPGFQVYVPASQNPWPTMTLVVRAAGDAAALAGSIRADVQELEKDQPVYNVRTFDRVVARAVALRRFQMLVLTLFAVVGLALATIGVYSVVACSVRLRTREFGLRLALGAPRRDILMLAIRTGLVWAGVGVVAGCAVALVAGRLLSGMLFGITPADPVTFIAVVSFTAAVVLLGSGIAARRAAGVDPLVALRYN